MISSEKSGPVKVETPVRCTESHSRLHKSISRPTVGMWTNPVGVRSIGKRFKEFCGYIEFVVTPGTFNLNFPENHDSGDRGKAVTKILNFVCSDGPG